jgi:hypothetical protein
MTRTVLSAVAVVLAALVCTAADTPERPDGIPDDYQCVYHQDFTDAKAMDDFVFTDPRAWKLAEAAGKKGLAYDNSAKYKPKVRSPRIIALIKDIQVKDFVLEADICQTGKEYGHRDACLFYGFTDPSNFYYTHIATKADPHAHNIFPVKDKPRTAIATKTTKGIDWGQNAYHHVRLVRRGSDGTILVYYDDMSKPLMEAKDTNFGWGWVGFGTFDDQGVVTNVRLWAKDVKKKACPFFKGK